MASVDQWIGIGSTVAAGALIYCKLPDRVHDEVRHFITKWTPLVAAYFNPYVQIAFSEYSSVEHFRRNKLFDHIAAYLGDKCTEDARRLKAVHGTNSSVDAQAELTLDEDMEVTDDFQGARLWWRARSNFMAPVRVRGSAISILPAQREPRSYQLVLHKRHRDLVINTYLPEILRKGQEHIERNRQRKLYTNLRGKGLWTAVPFEHPVTFDQLAMDAAMKEEIRDDLSAFKQGKDYYSKVGKAWKRGYLLHGPPGTGKSTLISAMANLLQYDVYDLDLTAVKSNAELRKLFIETTGKSIIVIEDIDAIDVDLTGNRKVDKRAGNSCHREGDGCDLPKDPGKEDNSKVTLSGLLSFVDGLWSACGGERIIVFTTNHVDRLDPALTRRGRMDMHIEMPYCRFKAFKVLADNYLKVSEHDLFREIEQLLDEVDMPPADVAHELMPKCNKRKRDTDEIFYERLDEYWDECLEGLVESLKTLKKAKKDSAATTSAQEKGKQRHDDVVKSKEAEGRVNGHISA